MDLVISFAILLFGCFMFGVGIGSPVMYLGIVVTVYGICLCVKYMLAPKKEVDDGGGSDIDN